MKLSTIKATLLSLVTAGIACVSFTSAYAESIKAPTATDAVKQYRVVDTGQKKYFNNTTSISQPSAGLPFYGQDAQYEGNQPSYTDNKDGTVSDNVTGLMWQQSFDHNGDGKIDVNDKLTYAKILEQFGKGGVTFGKYNDWRIPTIKEAYSLIIFSGVDVSPQSTSNENHTPFIDNKTFAFAYGDLAGGERTIDMQVATTNVYISDEVSPTVFGVNFADGRIKGYGIGGLDMPSKQAKAFNYLLVRGNTNYGLNNFLDNKDGTITDQATSLMWTQDDNAKGVLWEDALAFAENKTFAGYSDWRLPNAKELQSIVDYSRSPASTNSAAINPLFNTSQITNEAGDQDFPWYWTNTTHENEANNGGSAGIYVAFGRSLGNMPEMPSGKPPMGQNPNRQKPTDEELAALMKNAPKSWIDIHGAGSQRSDPKTGDPADYAEGHGPQGDAIRIYNFVRLVRDVK